jgi:hypothetical protein
MSEKVHIQINGVVTRDDGSGTIENAVVRLYSAGKPDDLIESSSTGKDGRFEIQKAIEQGDYLVRCLAFGESADFKFSVQAGAPAGRCEYEAALDVRLGLTLSFFHYAEVGAFPPADYTEVRRDIIARCESNVESQIHTYRWEKFAEARIFNPTSRETTIDFMKPGQYNIAVCVSTKGGTTATVHKELGVRDPVAVAGHVEVGGSVGVDGRVKVTMERTDSLETRDQALWAEIRERREAIGFERYRRYIQRVLELDKDGFHSGGLSRRLGELGARGVGAYQMLRDFTEVFVLSECGSISGEEIGEHLGIKPDFLPERHASHKIAERLRDYLREGRLPYIDRVLRAAYPKLDPDCLGLDALRSKMFQRPLYLELWHEMCLEHGMLMRTMDAISARFQNIYNSGENDGLSNYESSPLRPLSDFFWGWINTESVRLNARRRIQEYKHQYGPTTLDGSVLGVQAADVRTAFPDAFMNLMSLCEAFYWEDNQTTVLADAFPVLFGLKQVHQILAMGAGNTAPQLTFAARVETLMMQLMLAQPELRAFLRVREMVPYDEDWQASVDAMIDLQGWQQPSTTQHNDCAKFGEEILLSIRLADWTAGTEAEARNWLRDHREAIRRFTYAQHAISGPDLVAANSSGAPRAALAHDSRRAVPRGPQRAYPELGFGAYSGQGFEQNLRQFAPRLPNRGQRKD